MLPCRRQPGEPPVPDQLLGERRSHEFARRREHEIASKRKRRILLQAQGASGRPPARGSGSVRSAALLVGPHDEVGEADAEPRRHVLPLLGPQQTRGEPGFREEVLELVVGPGTV